MDRRVTSSLCVRRGPLEPLSSILTVKSVKNSLCTPVTVTYGLLSRTVFVLLDSGAARNLISEQLRHLLDIPKIPLTQTLPITSILGKPLGRGYITYKIPPIKILVGALHLEQSHFLVLEGSVMDIVFGHPWLCKHTCSVLAYW